MGMINWLVVVGLLLLAGLVVGTLLLFRWARARGSHIALEAVKYAITARVTELRREQRFLNEHIGDLLATIGSRVRLSDPSHDSPQTAGRQPVGAIMPPVTGSPELKTLWPTLEQLDAVVQDLM